MAEPNNQLRDAFARAQGKAPGGWVPTPANVPSHWAIDNSRPVNPLRWTDGRMPPTAPDWSTSRGAAAEPPRVPNRLPAVINPGGPVDMTPARVPPRASFTTVPNYSSAPNLPATIPGQGARFMGDGQTRVNFTNPPPLSPYDARQVKFESDIVQGARSAAAAREAARGAATQPPGTPLAPPSPSSVSSMARNAMAMGPVVGYVAGSAGYNLGNKPMDSGANVAPGTIVANPETARLVAQIPVDQAPPGVRAKPNDHTFWNSTETGRNLRNLAGAFSAIPGAGVLAGSGRIGMGMSALAETGRAVANGVNNGAMADFEARTGGATPQRGGAPELRQNPLRNQEAAAGIESPGQSKVALPAGYIPPGAAKPAGNGIQRIDVPGQAPLFTNLAADDPSNVTLMARGVPSAQNEAIMQGMSDRYSAQARRMAENKLRAEQFAADAAQAQRTNAASLAAAREVEGRMTTERQIRDIDLAISGARNNPVLQAELVKQKVGMLNQQGINATELAKSGDTLRGNMYTADQNLAGHRYTADQTLKGSALREGTERWKVGQQQQLAQRQREALSTALASQSGGTPNRIAAADALLAAGFSEQAKALIDAQAADDARRGKATDNTVEQLTTALGDKEAAGQAYSYLNRVTKGQYENLPEGERNAYLAEALARFKLVSGANEIKDAGLLQRLGRPAPAWSDLPTDTQLRGASLEGVGLGWTSAVGQPGWKDWRLNLTDGRQMYLRDADMDQFSRKYLLDRGVAIEGTK